jgi:hypothetical protein
MFIRSILILVAERYCLAAIFIKTMRKYISVQISMQNELNLKSTNIRSTTISTKHEFKVKYEGY